MLFFTNTISGPFYLNKDIFEDSFFFAWENHGFHKNVAASLCKKISVHLLNCWRLLQCYFFPKNGVIVKKWWRKEDLLKTAMIQKIKTVKKLNIILISILYKTEMKKMPYSLKYHVQKYRETIFLEFGEMLENKMYIQDKKILCNKNKIDWNLCVFFLIHLELTTWYQMMKRYPSTRYSFNKKGQGK